MGSAPAPPPVADPAGVSAGQFQSNLAAGESAQAATNVNQITPTGSLTYYQTGVGPNGVPTYSAVQQLTPQQQQLFNLQQLAMGIAGGAGTNMLARDFNTYSNLDPTQVIGTGTSGISGQLMSGYLQQMQPFFTNQTQQLDTQLRNQGLFPSPSADPSNPQTWGPYERAMYQNTQSQSNAVAGAAANFQPAAFQEASSLYALPAQLGEQLSGFNVPGNVGQTLASTAAANYQPPDVIGATASAEQLQQQAYAQQVANQSALLSGLMGIGSAAVGRGGLLSSDIRLKRDIIPYKYLKNLGIWLYKWRYIWSDEEFIGPMAHELERIIPDMVATDSNGFKYIIAG